MRITTITCHNVYNAGASLQAFALQAYLNQLGHDVRIINYIPDYLRHYVLWGGAYGKYNRSGIRAIYSLLKLPERLLNLIFSKRRKAFIRFNKKYLKLTTRIYSTNLELKKNIPEADIYIAGSDQIWNTSVKNGKDPAFYLDFAPEKCIKASYAASFSTLGIEDDYKLYVRNLLSKLDYISVRESTGLKILNDLNIQNGTLVLDPVFLLDQKFWYHFSSSIDESLQEEKYIFIYDFDRLPLIRKIAEKIASVNKWKIYSLQKLPYSDKNFWNTGPLEFLSLIKNSQFVLSNSFHATAFSIIYKKQFLVFNRKESINTRMKDLVDRLGLSERLLSQCETQFNDIDYSLVNIKLINAVDDSRNYLNTVLNAKK